MLPPCGRLLYCRRGINSLMTSSSFAAENGMTQKNDKFTCVEYILSYIFITRITCTVNFCTAE